MNQQKIIHELWKLFIKYYSHGGVDAGVDMWEYTTVLSNVSVRDISDHLEGKVTIEELYEKYEGLTQ